MPSISSTSAGVGPYEARNASSRVIDVGGGANDGFLGLDFAYWIAFGWGFGILGHAIYAFLGEHRISKVYAEERQRELSERR